MRHFDLAVTFARISSVLLTRFYARKSYVKEENPSEEQENPVSGGEPGSPTPIASSRKLGKYGRNTLLILSALFGFFTFVTSLKILEENLRQYALSATNTTELFKGLATGLRESPQFLAIVLIDIFVMWNTRVIKALYLEESITEIESTINMWSNLILIVISVIYFFALRK